MNTLFEVKNLSVINNNIKILKNIDFEINEGEILGIIGESGCGKSTLVRSVSRMLNKEEKITDGRVLFDGIDLLTLCDKEMKKIRGKGIGIVFQNPASTFNPVVKIGKQFREAINVHRKINKKQCIKECAELMKKLNLNDAECILDSYTFELSGGMSQRTAIALAMILKPKLLICDEPTTALDVTIQAKIIELIKKVQKERGISVIYITHDLGVVAKVADFINVMYAGKIVEKGTTDEIFYDPRHPYTWGLLSSMPDLDTDDERLYTIPGSPPNLLHEKTGDAFAPRNRYALEIDDKLEPPMFQITKDHFAATWLLDPRAPKVEMPVELKNRIERMKKEAEEHGCKL